MKKFFTVLAAFLCAVAGALALAACGGKHDADNEPCAVHAWSDTYIQDGDRHVQFCEVCGAKKSSSHTFIDGVCVCGLRNGAHTHNYEWVDNGDGTHKQVCKNSGCDAPEINAGSHDYTNGNCVCGKKKPSQAEKVLTAMAAAYNNANLNDLAAIVYGNGGAGYDVFVQNNSAEAFFQGYRKLTIESAELLYDDGIDAGFSVTATLVFVTGLDEDEEPQEIELHGNIYLVYKENEWRLTEVPSIDPVRKTVSTRENDGAELYFGDNIYSSVPVFVEIDEENGKYKITVPTESSSLKIGNYFKCFDPEWSLVTCVNNGLSGWGQATNVFSLNMNSQWKIVVYDDSGNEAEEWELVFLRKKNITVTFYDYDNETEVTAQTFMQFKKATSATPLSHDGATFLGWITSNGEFFDFTARIGNDLSLYAAYDTAATKSITDEIAALGELTLADKAKLNAIQTAYDALTPDEQAFVYNYYKFERALSDMFLLEWSLEFDYNGYYRIVAYNGSEEIVHIPENFGFMEIRVIDAHAFSDQTIKELYVPDTLRYFGSQSGSFNGTVIYCAKASKPDGFDVDFSGNASAVVWNVKDTFVENYLTFILHGDDTVTLAAVNSVEGGALVIPEYAKGYPVTAIESGALNGLAFDTLDMPFAFLPSVSVDSVNTLTVRGVDRIDATSFAAVKNAEISTLVLYGSATEIGARAFENFTSLTAVTLPDSVTIIGAGAFSGCTSLTDVVIPDRITSIGSGAFDGCPIENATVPVHAILILPQDTLKTLTVTGTGAIRDFAFANNSSLTSVTVSDGITGIGLRAFGDCSSLKNVVIADSVTEVDNHAFYNCPIENATIPAWATAAIRQNDGSALKTIVITGSGTVEWLYNCSSLTSVTVGEGVTEITGGAFSGSSSLTDISIPDSLVRIGTYAFGRFGYNSLRYNEYGNAYYLGNTQNPYIVLMRVNDTSASSYTVHSDTKFIYDEAFSGCNKLTGITLPDGVKSIGSIAFNNCSNLASINIPSSVTSLGKSAFAGCSALLQTENKVCYVDKWVVSLDTSANITQITLRDDTVGFCDNVFDDCGSLTGITVAESNAKFATQDGILYNKAKTEFVYIPKNLKGDVVIPDGITSIGYSAFSGRKLTCISLPDSITSIGYSAFSNCSELISINLPDSITNIGSQAFDDCLGLANIVIPENVDYIDRSTFDGCYRLVIYCKASQKPQRWSNDWNNSRPVVWNCDRNQTDADGNTYAEINGLRYALNDGNATVIGQSNTLSGAVTIPSVVTYDGTAYAVTRINRYAFYNCYNLTSVTIPESVVIVDEYAFYSASFFVPTILGIYCEAIAAPQGWQNSWRYNTRSFVIWDCNNNDKDENGYAYIEVESMIYSLKDGIATVIGQPNISGEIAIQATVEYNGSSYSVTGIASYAFVDRTEITSITIPNSVTSIEDSAFYGCSKITDITFNGTFNEWYLLTSGKNVFWYGVGYTSYNVKYTLHCTDGNFYCNGRDYIPTESLDLA